MNFRFHRPFLALASFLASLALIALIAPTTHAAPTTPAHPPAASLLQQPWVEARSAHFSTYSCGPAQEVAKLAARLEQFRIAYGVLAGTQAVASPPIVVMAFPSHASLQPFLPLYRGHPANLAAFFSRGSDENLIALALDNLGADSLESVFHEYAHLLFRHNELFWPLWLKEGMADVYSTFAVTGDSSIQIGRPMDFYLRLLAQKPWLSLHDLLAVTHNSPEYNERERQGIFYAQSWLLTHYLMLGQNPLRKTQFAQLTTLLRQGQAPEQAFTNAFQAPLPLLERELHAYLQSGRLAPLNLLVPLRLRAPQPLTRRALSPVEVCFRLGDQLLRLNRPDTARAWFQRARQLAPASPLGYEGLGLLAAEQDDHDNAVRLLREAQQRHSASFLAYYTSAREQYRLASGTDKNYSRLPPAPAADIRAALEQSLALMPDFGPAHHLLGIVELVQDENFPAAEAHLQRAIQLEPENPAFSLTLGQAQLLRKDPAAARRTLEPLCRPYIAPELRKQAAALLRQLATPLSP